MLLWLALCTALANFDPPYAVLNFSDYAPMILETAARPDVKNYSSWARNNIPLLDYPDTDVLITYYYRWRLFREHIETIKGLTLIDEFLPGSGGHPISCAAGHHFAEGMWLRDPSVLDEVYVVERPFCLTQTLSRLVAMIYVFIPQACLLDICLLPHGYLLDLCLYVIFLFRWPSIGLSVPET